MHNSFSDVYSSCTISQTVRELEGEEKWDCQLALVLRLLVVFQLVRADTGRDVIVIVAYV